MLGPPSQDRRHSTGLPHCSGGHEFQVKVWCRCFLGGCKGALLRAPVREGCPVLCVPFLADASPQPLTTSDSLVTATTRVAVIGGQIHPNDLIVTRLFLGGSHRQTRSQIRDWRGGFPRRNWGDTIGAAAPSPKTTVAGGGGAVASLSGVLPHPGSLSGDGSRPCSLLHLPRQEPCVCREKRICVSAFPDVQALSLLCRSTELLLSPPCGLVLEVRRLQAGGVRPCRAGSFHEASHCLSLVSVAEVSLHSAAQRSIVQTHSRLLSTDRRLLPVWADYE